MEHTCPYCCKQYKKKGFYERHILACEIIHRNDDDEMTETIPNHNQLYKLVKDLMLKVEIQQNEITKLKTHIQSKKRKINVKEWLEKEIDPDCSFSDFIKNIEMNEYSYNDIIKYDNVRDGMIYFLKESVFKHEERRKLPIQCFQEFKYVFYIYEDNVWKKMEQKEFERFCNALDTKVFNQFQEWKKTIDHKIDTCSKTNEYYMKIMSKLTQSYKNNNRQKYIQKINGALYNHWGVHLRSVVEYQYVM